MPKQQSKQEQPGETDKQWAIVEIFGHSRYAGTVSEHQIGGCSFVRVDVPEIDGQPAFTKLFGNAAIYSITPVSEQIARLVAKQFQSRPLTVYVEELEQSARQRRLKAVGEEED
jgi:hypothetical protein